MEFGNVCIPQKVLLLVTIGLISVSSHHYLEQDLKGNLKYTLQMVCARLCVEVQVLPRLAKVQAV